ncbi:hypothetical protein QCA50_002035 [Cerrena zonata]|uniref:NADH dehydrogenase [ubiquinone] 1 beta subcomplex subunit 11, mitochondrial n=1 Tax=Cerrena zonata TaxID=2478898 RepID=A0AAW0GSD1_9APHY
MQPSALTQTLRAGAIRRLPTTGRRYASGGHGPHYNEPSGWLFGEKPSPTGDKRKKEGWENIWYAGIYGGMAAISVLLYYKPDTTIQTWALQEAKARMEARGEKTDYP